MRFLDGEGDEFTPVSGFSLATAVASSAVASVVGQSGWTFRVAGESEGATTLTLSVRQDSETRYASPAIPIRVERHLGSVQWIAPDTLRPIVTAGPVAIEVAPFAGTEFARVDFGVNGTPLRPTQARLTASWDPRTATRRAGHLRARGGGLRQQRHPAGGRHALPTSVPAMAGDLSGRYGGFGDDRVYAVVELLSDAFGLIGETTMPDGNIQGAVMKLTPGTDDTLVPQLRQQQRSSARRRGPGRRQLHRVRLDLLAARHARAQRLGAALG